MDVINPSSHNRAMLWNWNIVHGLAIFGCLSGVSVFLTTPFITENKTLRSLAVTYGLIAASGVEYCYNHLNKIAPRVRAIHEKDTASFRSEITADFHVANVTNAMIGDYFVNTRKASLDSEPLEPEPEPYESPEPVRTLTAGESSAIELRKEPEPIQGFSEIELNPGERLQVLKSMANNETQTDTIFRVWGVKKGGSKAYKEALAKYKMIESELESDEDE